VSSLYSFSGHSTPPAIPVNAAVPAPRRSSRRASVAQASGSPRRFRSPRKSSAMRTSLAPSRRGVDQEKEKEKKSLRWKDEAGQGNLDDASPNAMTAADPSVSRTISFGGSESEWEDEKTEDSVNFSMSFSASVPNSSGTKRSRSSRLDPSYLKANKGSSALGSLAEDDESPSNVASSRRPGPLSDRGNQMDNGSSPSFKLALPKGRSAAAMPRVPGSASKSGRRRSQVGPVRSEKTSRRRSSLIPQPSPTNGKPPFPNGARRVPVESARSPAKRVKRASLLGAPRMSGSMKILKSSTLPSLVLSASTVFDQNGSACGAGKPTWR